MEDLDLFLVNKLNIIQRTYMDTYGFVDFPIDCIEDGRTKSTSASNLQCKGFK